MKMIDKGSQLNVFKKETVWIMLYKSKKPKTTPESPHGKEVLQM